MAESPRVTARDDAGTSVRACTDAGVSEVGAAATFSNATALTLNSGCSDAGSTASLVTALMVTSAPNMSLQ